MKGYYNQDAVEGRKSNTLLQILKLFATFVVSTIIVGLIFTFIMPDDPVGNSVFGPKADVAWILISIAMTIVSAVIVEYNTVQRLKNTAQRYKSEIKIADETSTLLISKAERVADKYRNTEEGLFEKFADARTEMAAIRNSRDFRAVMENYPGLKSNIHTQKLLSQIETTEQQRDGAKKAYAETVAKYNGRIHSFPISIFREMLKLDDIITYEQLIEDIVSDEELGI